LSWKIRILISALICFVVGEQTLVNGSEVNLEVDLMSESDSTEWLIISHNETQQGTMLDITFSLFLGNTFISILTSILKHLRNNWLILHLYLVWFIMTYPKQLVTSNKISNIYILRMLTNSYYVLIISMLNDRVLWLNLRIHAIKLIRWAYARYIW